MSVWDGTLSDVWERMARSGKPLVLYGTGDGADKILSVMERRGLRAAGVFASDGFVRSRTFQGMPVLSLEEARARFGDMLVVIAFGSSRPEVLANFARLDAEFETVAPDVPIAGTELFDRAFFDAHRARFEELRDWLYDAESRTLLEEILYAKLTGSITALLRAYSDRGQVWRELLHPERWEAVCDLGAYNGDTLRELLEVSPGIGHLYAMEPDVRSFRKLSAWAEQARPDAVLCNAAAWNAETTLRFAAHGSRSSGAGALGKTVEVCALPPDSLLQGARVDYIKYDVEGAETEALAGSAQTIRRWRPALCVSAYHRSADLAVLPRLIRSIREDYRFYLRRWAGVPAWDINLYCL